MKAKNYLLVLIVLLMFSSSLPMLNVPVKALEPYVRVYVYQPLGYIPGVDPGPFQVDIYIETSGITDNSMQGIVGWAIDIQVDPGVIDLSYAYAYGAQRNYTLWQFARNYTYPGPTLLQGWANATTGFWDDLAEMIMPAPPGGAGDATTASYPKLVTLEFDALSKTAYSRIDLIDVEYMITDGTWHAADEVKDGYYNPPPVHTLTVESTPIDGVDFTVDSASYTTNATVQLVEGDHTVTMPDLLMVGMDHYKFLKWEDDSTNRVRTINLTSNKTITATYELYVPPVHTLAVESTPIDGINFTIDATTYTTNRSVGLPEGNYTVTMPSTWMVDTDHYNFLKWEDDSTNRVRTINLTSNKTITATYELELDPTASFRFSPTEPIVAETVTFNASASNDPDGTIVSYFWDFGDGTNATETDPIATHTYTESETYTVTLTVTDDDELTDTITKSVTVKEAPPSGIPLEIYVAAAGVIAIIVIAIALYYLRKRGKKSA
jgi:PKD repeat protein